MNEIWCVIECSSKGEIFDPEFFASRDEAVAYVKEDSMECYGQAKDPSNTRIDFHCQDDDIYARVCDDKENYWTWGAFEVTDKLMSIYLMHYMKAKENNNV